MPQQLPPRHIITTRTTRARAGAEADAVPHMHRTGSRDGHAVVACGLPPPAPCWGTIPCWAMQPGAGPQMLSMSRTHESQPQDPAQDQLPRPPRPCSASPPGVQGHPPDPSAQHPLSRVPVPCIGSRPRHSTTCSGCIMRLGCGLASRQAPALDKPDHQCVLCMCVCGEKSQNPPPPKKGEARATARQS